MNPEQDDFKQLRQLLALKRYEQPPPGYFQSFSREVIYQIKSEAARTESSFAERLFGEAPWLQRWWKALETKPAFAGGLSFAICGLLVAGLLYSDAPAGPNVGTLPGMLQASDFPPTLMIAPRPALVDFSSTNGFYPQPEPFRTENSLFFPAGGHAQPVSWSP